MLIAPLDGVGRDYPLSIEKLCPVLSYYVVKDWREGCERCKQILRYGGMGHTMSIHSQNEQVILEFGLQKPAFRIVRQHADDARVDRADDRPRSGDDARLRRLRRQHHVGQHLAAPPAEHQAAGVRGYAGGQPLGPYRASGAPVSADASVRKRPIALRTRAAAAASRHQRRRRCPGGSTSSSGRGDSTGQTAAEQTPRPDAREARRRSTSSARRTSGWPFRRDASWWCRSARS